QVAATISHHCSHLIFRRLELIGIVYLDKHNERTSAAVSLLISRVRNVDHVVAREAEDRSQWLQHAKNQIRPAVDSNLLPNGSVGWRIIEQVLQHVRTNHADLTTGSSFAVGPDASGIDRHTVDIEHRNRIDTANPYVLCLLIVVLDSLNRIRGDADTPARRTRAQNRFRIFVCDVFAAIGLYE